MASIITLPVLTKIKVASITLPAAVQVASASSYPSGTPTPPKHTLLGG